MAEIDSAQDGHASDTTMAHRRIPIAALRIGMHVAKLDRSWFRSPFLRHSFMIRTEEQIDKLTRNGIREVEIDPGRGLDLALNPDATTAAPVGESAGLPESPDVNPIRSLETLTQDMVLARQARQRLEQSVRSTFSQIAATGVVDPEDARRMMLEMSAVTQTLARPALFMALSQDRTVDPLLSQHALATCGLSMILAHAAHFDLLKLQALATGALLHDIGLLQLPAHIRRRCFETSAPLSQLDQHRYQSHPRLAAMALQRQGGFSPAICQLVAEHHALLDNTGFPKEARGNFTTDMTRVIMVTDRYDELLTGFGGASPLTPHQALQRLYEEGQAGKYESVYISLFVKVMGIYPVYSCVELNTKERAIVTVINSKKLHLPIITITQDPTGTPYIVPLVIDLANQDERAPHRSVVTVIETASDAIVAAVHHASV